MGFICCCIDVVYLLVSSQLFISGFIVFNGEKGAVIWSRGVNYLWVDDVYLLMDGPLFIVGGYCLFYGTVGMFLYCLFITWIILMGIDVKSKIGVAVSNSGRIVFCPLLVSDKA